MHEPTQTCVGPCGQDKPLSDFYKVQTKVAGGVRVTKRRTKCRRCYNAQRRELHDPVKDAAYYQRVKAERPEALAEWGRTRRFKKYGLTKEEGETLLARGACECCGRVTNALAIDHCHDTGKVRGALCHSCNTAIGKLGDGVDGVWKALDYLLATATAVAD